MQKFVAFLDISGFKNLVRQKGSDEMAEIMYSFKSAIDLANNIPIPEAPSPTFTASLVRFATFLAYAKDYGKSPLRFTQKPKRQGQKTRGRFLCLAKENILTIQLDCAWKRIQKRDGEVYCRQKQSA